MPLIVEGLVTTVADDGGTHVAPMGPVVDSGADTAWRRLVLRPYQTAATYRHLKRVGVGVLHVTDDVELIAQTAIGPPLAPLRVASLAELAEVPAAVEWVGIASGQATGVDPAHARVLLDACRWYAFRIVGGDESQPRTELTAEIFARGRLRDFFGFHRARHAVLEAAILATRTGLLPRADMLAEFVRLAILVEKTGGPAEERAFALLREYVERNATVG